MFTQNDVQQLTDATVYDADGDKVGGVGQVYLDADSGDPEWVTVKTGLFGTRETFVPLDRASFTGDRIEVPFDKARIKDAPKIEADGPLSVDAENELYSYYGSGSGSTAGSADVGDRTDTGRTDGTGDTDRTVGTGTTAGTGTTTGRGDDDAMTRSEEHLVAGTRTEETGRARLRKHVVTEQQQVTVPVTREEVSLEREPITDADAGRALSGSEISEGEHEVILHAERPVVDTEAVPVERVRLNKQTVTDQERVSGEVRKEQIDFDGADRDTRS